MHLNCKLDNLARRKKCSPLVLTKVPAEPAVVEVPLSTVANAPLSVANAPLSVAAVVGVDHEDDDAAPPIPPHTEASTKLQNEPKSNEELYPSTGQMQTQRQNKVAY